MSMTTVYQRLIKSGELGPWDLQECPQNIAIGEKRTVSTGLKFCKLHIPTGFRTAQTTALTRAMTSWSGTSCSMVSSAARTISVIASITARYAKLTICGKHLQRYQFKFRQQNRADLICRWVCEKEIFLFLNSASTASPHISLFEALSKVAHPSLLAISWCNKKTAIELTLDVMFNLSIMWKRHFSNEYLYAVPEHRWTQ